MKTLFNKLKMVNRAFVAIVTGLLTLAITHTAYAGIPSQSPVFLSAPVRPIMMLNMSKEHQLFFKLYDDYSDITDANGGDADGAADTTYNNNYDYYGYFDSEKCYVYDINNKRFNPSSVHTNRYCNVAPASGEWSGNFLNWSTMTRIDAVRKILYGGLRSTDTATLTVLERAFLPNDAHSFAKYYTHTTLAQLTPFSAAEGVTICNTSEPKDRASLSQQATSSDDVPLIRVARGNYSLWASNERWQCRWGVGSNGNNATVSKINASSNSPVYDTVGLGDYVARVKVCDTGAFPTADTNEHCYAYDTVSTKPTGLLQLYGANDSIYFGLLTGSYGKNKSGGVLRKKAGSFTDEINADGTFKIPVGGNSIVKTLDLLRIYGYRFDDGTYHSKTDADLLKSSDKCIWAKSTIGVGECSNWGNPQAEIYLESLRYLAGATTPLFDTDDSKMIAGLNRVSDWTAIDPITSGTSGNYCAPLNVLQFNASTTSYDTDDLTGGTSSLTEINTATDAIGLAELITGNFYFVGENGDANNQICDAKQVTALSKLKGVCPESPRLEGGYKMAGLAYLAHKKGGIKTGREGVKTYGVALAPAIPKVSILVPGSTKTVTILPACRNLQPNPDASCAIVDFKIVEQSPIGSNPMTGKLYVNWEDSEQGGDFDQDMWGMIDYKISANSVEITTQVVAESSGDAMGFGYVLSGTSRDGFHVHSGMHGFVWPQSEVDLVGCQDGCEVADGPSKETYTVGASAAAELKNPLYYAAKWGGYNDLVKADGSVPTEAETLTLVAGMEPTKTYFYATDPRKLEDGLKEAMGDIAASVGSAATVAANSTRLEGESLVYQARFKSKEWSGRMLAYPLSTTDGSIDTTDKDGKGWDTDSTLPRGSTRFIYTYGATNSASAVQLTSYAAAPLALQTELKAGEATDVNAIKRFNWLLGSADDESVTGGMRARTHILGDIVNSDPAFAGANSQRYDQLDPLVPSYGAASYQAFVDAKKNRKPAIFVGANDGMMHAFNADSKEKGGGTELFTYIPRGVYKKLAEVSKPTYTHQYLVDGPMYAGDVFIGGAWRTIVAGTLGAGGRGAYALDVTDTLLDSSAAPKVIFDVTDTDAGIGADLGYALGKILIVPTANAGWTAIFGNGTNSINGIAKLIAINLANTNFTLPGSYIAIDTKAKMSTTSLDNGLSGVALLPGNAGVVNYAYAGDLMGNMWKFDLTSSTLTNWSVAYGNATPKPLITVIDPFGVAQPITSTPTLGLNDVKPLAGGAKIPNTIMVYFGTGKYFESTDNTTTQVQSIYGIADAGKEITLTVANRTTTQLVAKVMTQNNTTKSRTITPDATVKVLGTSTPAVDWTSKNGWVVDLIVDLNVLTGERVLSKPLLLFDRILLNTFIPSVDQCKYGGEGWLMELTGVGDKYVGHSILGDKGNHLLEHPIIGDLNVLLNGEKVVLLGSGLGKKGEDPELVSIEGNAAGGTRGRMSWRQLK